MNAADYALQLFAALFRPYEGLLGVSSLRFEIRCRHGKGRKPVGVPPRAWFPLTPGGYAEAAVFVTEDGFPYDCYVSVLPRVGNMGTSESVACAAVLWASVDNNQAGPSGAIDLLKAARFSSVEPLPPPHFAIASGGGVHCGWFLSDLRNIADVEARRQFGLTVLRLARCIGGSAPGAAAETNAGYCSYMVRVPGSYNRKSTYVEPRPVRLLRLCPDAEAKPLTWWRAHLPAEPIPEHEKRANEYRAKNGNRDFGRERINEMPREALALLNAPAPESTRHDTAVRIAAILFAAQWGKGAAVAVLEGFAARNAWRVEKNEIAYIVRHFERKQPLHA